MCGKSCLSDKNFFSLLAYGRASMVDQDSTIMLLKTRMRQLAQEYGDPAIGVPDEVQQALDECAR